MKYDYSKVDYKNNHSNVVIVCPNHGNFEQSPSNHLKGSACPSCAVTGMGSTDDFIKRASSVHNGYYQYDKTVYKGTRFSLIVTCPKHGDFKQRPQTHVEGSGCRKCAGNMPLTTDIFIKKSKIKHGDRYNYKKSKYVSNTSKVIIICRSHGEFIQTTDSHMRGKGCPTCGGINQGWSKTDFKRACIKNKNGLATLYVIRCFNNQESFYKVGITSKSIKTRFSGKGMPYAYEVIHNIKAGPSVVWDIEVEILKDKYRDRYKPKICFGGDTECFLNIDGIYRHIEKAL